MTPSPLPPTPPPAPAIAARPPGPPAAGRPPETAAFDQWLDQARSPAKAPPGRRTDAASPGSPPSRPQSGPTTSAPSPTQTRSDDAARTDASDSEFDETNDASTSASSARRDDGSDTAPGLPNAAGSAAVIDTADGLAGGDATDAAGARATNRRGALPGLRGDAPGGRQPAAMGPDDDPGKADLSREGQAVHGRDPAAVRADGAHLAADRRDAPVAGTEAASGAAPRHAGANAAADGAVAVTTLGSGPSTAAPGTPSIPVTHDGAARGAMPPDDTLPTPVHSPAFGPALAARVVVMLREGTREARLQLNPAELGPIGVRISVDGSQARVDLVADQAPTRSVLEQALPTLAGALRDSGLTLAGGGVFDAPPDGRQGDQEAPADTRGSGTVGHGAGADDPARPGTAPAPRAARGLLDLYA